MRNTAATKRVFAPAVAIALAVSGCATKHTAAPPAPQVSQNVFALLPEPGGKSAGIVVKNAAGAQELSQPYQAVRVERNDVAPGTPFTLSEADVKRLFGAAIDVLPTPEVQFVLHFDEGREELNAESQALIPAILNAIRERHSTVITVTGHTDTVASPEFNYELGLRRAQGVAAILLNQGVDPSYLFVSSHGDSDLLVKTDRGVVEARNRRVEVIVR